MTEIITAERKHGHSDLRRIAARHPSSTGDRAMPAQGVALEPTVLARVNDGRWIADCPDEFCGGAEYVSFDSPFFFCCECRNAAVGHLPLPVTVPGVKLRGEIEAALLPRPVRNRQWLPGETVAKLRAENKAAGIEGVRS